MDKYEKLRMEIIDLLFWKYQLDYLTLDQLESLKQELQKQVGE